MGLGKGMIAQPEVDSRSFSILLGSSSNFSVQQKDVSWARNWRLAINQLEFYASVVHAVPSKSTTHNCLLHLRPLLCKIPRYNWASRDIAILLRFLQTIMTSVLVNCNLRHIWPKHLCITPMYLVWRTIQCNLVRRTFRVWLWRSVFNTMHHLSSAMAGGKWTAITGTASVPGKLYRSFLLQMHPHLNIVRSRVCGVNRDTLRLAYTITRCRIWCVFGAIVS